MDTDSRKRLRPLEILFLPLIGLHKLTGFLLRKVLGEDYAEITEDDIRNFVDSGNENGLFEDTSAEIISNAFEFDDLTAADVMTHRVNVVGADEHTGLDEIIYLALEKGFSRIPVYSGNIDRISGIVIVKDLLSLIGGEGYRDFRLKDFVREVLFIPEACPCGDTFKALTAMKTGMAVVADEYGGTAGIVTLEDLIEAVMGNIQDEYDEESSEIKEIGKEKYEISGEADPEDVLALFGLQLPPDHEYDTISGFVTDLLGHIPDTKDTNVVYNNIRFIVKQVDDNCISRLIAFKID